MNPPARPQHLASPRSPLAAALVNLVDFRGRDALDQLRFSSRNDGAFAKLRANGFSLVRIIVSRRTMECMSEGVLCLTLPKLFRGDVQVLPVIPVTRETRVLEFSQSPGRQGNAHGKSPFIAEHDQVEARRNHDLVLDNTCSLRNGLDVNGFAGEYVGRKNSPLKP